MFGFDCAPVPFLENDSRGVQLYRTTVLHLRACCAIQDARAVTVSHFLCCILYKQ